MEGRAVISDSVGWFRNLMVAFLTLSLASVAPAQQAPESFKPEEIEALVAPIALYPDALLSQVLMASTYPLEVVQAARWVKANPSSKGDAAVRAVESQTWDVSVKSLVAFPQILEPMSDKLDWTQQLGDAFLADQKSVLDAVQRLRLRAQAAGNLSSNEQQRVIVEAPAPQQTVIRIEPASPQVIYVPAYNPVVVYGTWGYAAYPPYYWPPSPVYYPGGALASGFAWGIGFAAAGAIFGNCNWGRGGIDIDINRATNIDRNINVNNVNVNRWEHNTTHRKGVSYRDSATREKYGRDVPGLDRRQDFRGHDSGGARDARPDLDRPGGGNRAGPGIADRSTATAGRADRAGIDRQPVAAASPARREPSHDGHAGAFQGVDSGRASQRDADRGRASTQRVSAPAARPAAAPARPTGRPSGGGAHAGAGIRR